MDKLFTHCMDRDKKRTEEKCLAEMKISPRRQTVDFLRQFARVYQCEPTLSPDICGFVLN